MLELKERLENVKTRRELDGVMSYLLGMMEDGRLEKADFAILELFREKIYLFLSQGELLNKTYLALYELFLDAPSDERFAGIERAMTPALFSTSSDNENVLILEVIALIKILSGRVAEGLDFFLQNIIKTDIHCIEAQKSSEFILAFFNGMKIPFEVLSRSLKTLLQRDFDKLTLKQKRSVFNWQLHVFWNVKHFYNHRDWLNFYPIWRDIFYSELQKNTTENLDFALYLHFVIYHLCGNNYASQDEWRIFNTEITGYGSRFYEKFASSLPPPPPSPANGKKLIAILRDRLVSNSPYKVEYSFLQNLMKNEDFLKKYEVKLYVMSLIEKSDNDPRVIQSYRDLGIEIIDMGLGLNQAAYYNSHLAKALALRERMSQDGAEILISPNNGYGISDFLFASRVCKNQIFWSHGNFVYDSRFIDCKVTHICGDQRRIKHEGYEFIGIPVKMDQVFYNPLVAQNTILQHREKFPKNALIFGVIGRLVKIDCTKYLQAVIEILRAFSPSVFLACGIGNEDEIKQKIAQIDAGMLDSFVFTGFVDSAIYGHVIDLWLDSFPMQQGESRIEYVAKGNLAIVFSKESREERSARLKAFINEHQDVFKTIAKENQMPLSQLFDCFEDEACVAFSQEDYVKKAICLAKMKQENTQALQKKLHEQRLVRLVNDYLRERDGVENFLSLLGGLK